jgi:tape measure domain-containing protein
MLSDLIVPIDADLGGLRKGLRDAQQLIRRSTADLNALGNSLARSISLPLAGIGVGAIKAAADLEQLTTALSTTMQGAGYSIQEATKEMQALRDAAKAPGLDFEQSVKGSIRLQNVGYSAAKARDILVQLANAVSMSGGTATELDSVTRQMAQMSAKGRILQEDLTIMVENMPVLSKIMKETFGTASAEALRNMGLSADQFIEGITKGMALLPRVTGGLANDIVNAFNAIKLAAAQVGMVLNERLRVGEKLSQFADFISGLADAFQALSPEAQSAILYTAAFAAALGPAIRVSSALISTLGGVQNAIAKSIIFYKEWKLGTEAMTAAQIRMNTVMKANVIGVLVGAALALAAAYVLLRKDTSAAAQSQQDLSEISSQANEYISEEKVSTGLLVETLKSNIKTLDEKKAALKQLNQIAPEYFKGLDAEKINIDALNAGYAKYIENLLRAARAKAAEEKLIKIDQERMELAEKRAKFMDADRSGGEYTGLGQNLNIALQAQRAQKEILEGYEEEDRALRFREDRLKEQIIANTDFSSSVADTTNKTKNNTDATKDNTKAKSEQNKEVDAANEKWEKEIKMLQEIEKAWADEAKAVDDAMAARAAAGPALDTSGFQGQVLQLGQNLATALTPVQQLFANLKDQFSGGLSGFGEVLPQIDPNNIEAYETTVKLFQEMETALTGLKDGLLGFDEAFKAVSAYIAQNGTLIQQTFMAMGDAIGQAAQSGASSFRELATAALKSAREIVGAWIRQGVAAAVSKALSGLPFPFNIAAGAAAGGLAQAAFNKVLQGLKIPAFAAGTNYAPGGLSLVGELGPELVNLPRGSQVIPNHRLGDAMGGGMHLSGTFVVRGSDLVYVIEEETRKQRRKR